MRSAFFFVLQRAQEGQIFSSLVFLPLNTPHKNYTDTKKEAPAPLVQIWLLLALRFESTISDRPLYLLPVPHHGTRDSYSRGKGRQKLSKFSNPREGRESLSAKEFLHGWKAFPSRKGKNLGDQAQQKREEKLGERASEFGIETIDYWESVDMRRCGKLRENQASWTAEFRKAQKREKIKEKVGAKNEREQEASI